MQLCCLMMQLYQQPFKTYQHHHPVSAAISKLNYLARRMARIHRSTFMTALQT